MTKYWTKQQDDILRKMWGTCFVEKISKELGRTRNAVIGRAYRLALPRLATGGGERTYKLDSKRIVLGYAAGLSLREISLALGYSLEGVRQTLLRNGVKIRPPHVWKP